MEVEATFSDYEDAGGLKLPKRITTKTDRFTTADVTLTRNQVDGEAGDIAAPDAVRSAVAPPPPPINVTVEPAGKGIWWLAGGTHRGNEAFLREIASRKHTLGQDALAKTPKEPVFQLMDDQLILKDATNEVHLFKANGNIHTGLLVYGWIPRDRTLVQADFYDLNWLQHPWGDNFIENLAARKLNPARHLPIHGKIQTHQEVLQVLASKPKAPPQVTE